MLNSGHQTKFTELFYIPRKNDKIEVFYTSRRIYNLTFFFLENENLQPYKMVMTHTMGSKSKWLEYTEQKLHSLH